MKPDQTSYKVTLQVQDESGEFKKLPVSVQARDKDNARTAAIEKAEKDGYKVTNCHTVEVNS